MDRKYAAYLALGAVGIVTIIVVTLLSVRRAGVAEGKAVAAAQVLGVLKGEAEAGDVSVATDRDPSSADKVKNVLDFKGLAAPIGS